MQTGRTARGGTSLPCRELPSGFRFLDLAERQRATASLLASVTSPQPILLIHRVNQDIVRRRYLATLVSFVTAEVFVMSM